MNTNDFNKLVIKYGALKAHDIMTWFNSNTDEFKSSIKDQYKFCVNNEYLWFNNKSLKTVCINVKVMYAPISERYWYKTCDGKIFNNQIRVSGCWFNFDERWNVFYE